MGNNLSIESPNFEKIDKEAGQFTSSAVATLWAALNEVLKSDRTHFTIVQQELFVNPNILSAAASVDNLDMRGFSALQFTGGSAQNFTGMVAPEFNKVKIIYIKVTGTGTITAKHNVTSLATNRLSLATGADFAMTTGKGLIVGYMNTLWVELARSG
jgi:hypothetical protein